MRSLRLICLVVICLAGTVGTAHAELIFNGSSLGDFAEVNGAAGTFSEVTDPLGSGQTVFKTTVKNSETGPFGNPRTEAVSPAFIEQGDEFWLKTKILFPKSFPTSISGGMELAAIYGPPFGGQAPWTIETNGEAVYWQRNGYNEYDIPWAIPLERERWIGIVLHERFDEEGKGFVEMWVNGERVTFFEENIYNPGGHAPTPRLEMATMDGSNDSGPNSAKILQSRELGAAETATVYFGSLKIGEPAPTSANPGSKGRRSKTSPK